MLTAVYTSVGVVVGLLLAELTGWVWVDAVVGLLVGLNIMWHGWQLVWRSSQGLMDVAMEPQQLQTMEVVLAQQVQTAQAETGASISFDSLRTRQAGERCFVDLHLHVPGEWSLFQAAHWREQAEAALMAAVPGLQARIELLPEGANTLYEKHADEGMPPAGAM